MVNVQHFTKLISILWYLFKSKTYKVFNIILVWKFSIDWKFNRILDKIKRV